MNIFALFRRGVINTAALALTAGLVHEALTALEAHLSAKGDKRGLVVARSLHGLLEALLRDHGPAAGLDVTALSGGTPKELPQ